LARFAPPHGTHTAAAAANTVTTTNATAPATRGPTRADTDPDSHANPALARTALAFQVIR